MQGWKKILTRKMACPPTRSGSHMGTSWILIGVFILDMSERSVPHFKGHGQCLSTYTTGLVPTVL